MEISEPQGDSFETERQKKARLLYGHLFGALHDALVKLKEDEGDSKEAIKERQELFRLYTKQLQTVFEIEGSLADQSRESRVSRIDLDAARTEISERIHRIREQN